LAPEGAALRRHNRGFDLLRLKIPFVTLSTAAANAPARHLLEALPRTVAELDEAGPNHRDLVPAHEAAPVFSTSGRAL